MNELFGPIVHSYSRADAINDGVLVDLTALYPEECRLYRYPVACTVAVWSLVDKAVTNRRYCNDEAGVIWDILYMSQHRVIAMPDAQTVLFKVVITGTGNNKIHTMKAVCGPGDTLEPVITIMLPDED
jgi:hypothetical protein